MDISELLKDYGVFNHWANTHIIEWLGKHPADLLERQTPSSFPTLKLTILHIWGAEEVWRSRLQGISPTAFPSENFHGTTDEMFSGLLDCSARFRDFLGAQAPVFFETQIHYTHTTGTPYTQYSSEIILHCLQHSTYHRGQIITMARSLGITDVPHTDYIRYVRGKS